MSLTRSIAIQPTIVNEVIEELLDTDIIHPNKINQLKNENEMPYYDPNILMDIRHKQVKHKNCSTYKESINMGIRTTNKTSSQPNVNFLQVDKEIEKFKKELEIERKKLYELNKISNPSNHINKEINTIPHQPVPVTNVVTQLKNKVKSIEISSNTVAEKHISVVKNDVTFIEKPIEVFGYKPLSMTDPLNKKRCLNEQSCSCPHRVRNIELNEKDNEIIKQTKKMSKYNKKSELNSMMTENKSNEKHEFVCAVTKLQTKKIQWLLANKTIEKWKQFVTRQKITRFDKNKEMQEMKQRKYLQKKYWEKWIIFCENKKQLKEQIIKQKSRIEKLNLFFEKLEETKNNLSKTTKKIPDKVNRELKDNELFIKKNKNIINNGSIFANRLNAQKTVIQEQKLKLEEQNKLIQQLFEEKLKEQIKETNKNILSNLQETAKNCNSNLKPKVKVLANSSSIYMDSKKPTDCTFVKRMNQREQERRERWEISRMRKQLIEDEKKKKEVEEEQKKREEEEEMRKKKILEKKEKIKLQREIELKKLLCAEEIKRKMEIAKEHYNSYLLKKIINVFKKNIQYKKQLECECTNYCNKKLLNLYFKEWKKNAQYSVKRKFITADAFYNFNLLHRSWTAWILFYSEAVQKLQVAEDFYDAKLSEKTFNKWKIFTNKQRIEYEKRIEYAINHYNRNLLKNYFNRLKQLPLKMYKTREEEKRIRLWRDKVLEIIPDYTPELESDD